MTAQRHKASAQRRLTSWKEIAAFLGRDERTAKRWEASRGLPVRRMPGAGHSSVFAYTDEIEAWMRGGALPEPPADTILDTSNPDTQDQRRWVIPALGVLLAGIIIAIVGLFALGRNLFLPTSPKIALSADPVATEFYRSGLHAWQTRTPAGLVRAIAEFKRAVDRDPRYAAAYVGLADAYSVEPEFMAIPPQDAYPRAEAAARRAIALDPSLASAHATLAFVDFYWSRNPTAADTEFRRALALDPGSAIVHHWYATFLMSMGRFDASLVQIDRAETLDSESSAIPADKGLILFLMGRDDLAVKLLTQLEDEQPDFASPHQYLATIWRDEGKDKDYLREMKLGALARHDPIDAIISDAGVKGLASAGHIGMLRSILNIQRDYYRAGKVTAYALAVTSIKLGNTDDAITYLSTSIARHETENIALAVDKPFAALRRDRRCAALMARAGLNAYR
jgi:tetratricopeptide (TPR) repeat protein